MRTHTRSSRTNHTPHAPRTPRAARTPRTPRANGTPRNPQDHPPLRLPASPYARAVTGVVFGGVFVVLWLPQGVSLGLITIAAIALWAHKPSAAAHTQKKELAMPHATDIAAFTGYRTDGSVEVTLTTHLDRQRRLHHREDASGMVYSGCFDWGPGAHRIGAYTLACAILAEHFNDPCYAAGLARDFTESVVMTLDPETWTITPAQIDRWVEARALRHPRPVRRQDWEGKSPHTLVRD